MMRPSLRIKHGRRLLIEVEEAVEGVQEAGEEEVGDLGEGEGEVGEGVREFGAIKVWMDRKMNLVEDHRDMASCLEQKRLEQSWRELCPFEIWEGGVNSIFVSYTYAVLIITPAAFSLQNSI